MGDNVGSGFLSEAIKRYKGAKEAAKSLAKDVKEFGSDMMDPDKRKRLADEARSDIKKRKEGFKGNADAATNAAKYAVKEKANPQGIGSDFKKLIENKEYIK